MSNLRECSDYWKAKDYFNGLNVGLYLVPLEQRSPQYVRQYMRLASGGDDMRLWALLPARERRQQQLALKKMTAGNQHGWFEDYKQAESALRTTILAGLELSLAPNYVLRRFAPPPVAVGC